MLTKRARSSLPSGKKEKQDSKPDLEEFINSRNFTGAIAILEFNKQENKHDPKWPTLPWLGYCAFHLGDYSKAKAVYQEILQQEEKNGTAERSVTHLYLACCLYFLGEYRQADLEALKGPKNSLQNRILLHIAHKFNDEEKIAVCIQGIQNTLEDQLSLAAIHCQRGHYQEATDIYKRVITENKEFLAMNVYVALCYFKQDYFDISQEILNVYLQQHPDSAIAVNMKACNTFRMVNGKAAEADLSHIIDFQNTSYSWDYDAIRHNTVVFRGGENALQVLPGLINTVPEARLNLVIQYLKRDEIQEAFNLMKDVEPISAYEFILKGVVHAAIGQMTDSREHIKRAQQYFQVVGTSASECDTIPGRQCMASCYFLLKQFDEVITYLKSIQAYYSEDDLHWNLGIAHAAWGNYQEAEESLQAIQSEKLKADYSYLSWLARCYIMNGKPRAAWELYVKMETTSESFSLLQLIANDCYRLGTFYYSAKAFDVLERLDPNPEYWEGKRGACVGLFQAVIAGKEPQETIRDVLAMLGNTTTPQAEIISRVIRKWARDNKIIV